MRRVDIYWWQGDVRVRIGTIAKSRTEPTYFEWDKDFLNNPIELSPISFKKSSKLIECPDRPFDGLPGFLADHVPDGWGRILLRKGLEKQGVDANVLSPLDMLQYVADDSMGALSFEPSLREGEIWSEGQVDLAELEKGIEPILSGTPSEVLEEFIAAGVSPNGMRPKIILKEMDGTYHIGGNNAVDNEWLVKFPAPEDSRDIGKVEYIYSLMARSSGLRMAETKLVEVDEKHYFTTKRFDREGRKRLHVHTLSGMLHVPPSNFSVGYEHLLKVTANITRDVREVEQAFQLATFNIFSCNQDDHSKNVAFIMDEKGVWKLAPAYDLTYAKTRFSEHKMSLSGNSKPSRAELVNFGLEFGIAKSRTHEILDATEVSLSKFAELAKQYEVSKGERGRIADSIEVALTRGKSLA